MAKVSPEVRFDRVWSRLAARGQCDGIHGAQYRRVRQEWDLAGRPPAIAAFIRERANIGSFDPVFPGVKA